MYVDSKEQRTTKEYALNLDDADANFLVNLLFTSSLNKGFIPDNFLDHNQHLQLPTTNRQPIIFIASSPKSGSTFISGCLLQLLDLAEFPITRYGGNENDISLLDLCLASHIGTVARSHTKATTFNLHYLTRFNINPIIIVRNIYDTVISLAKDLLRYLKHGRDPGYSFLYHTEQHFKMNQADLIEMVIDLALPWFVNFYISWQDKIKAHNLHSLWLNYDSIMSAKEQTLTDILDFIKANKKYYSKINTVIDHFYTNHHLEHNQDQINPAGIGIKLLSDLQIARINRLFSYYPNCDFKHYGLI